MSSTPLENFLIFLSNFKLLSANSFSVEGSKMYYQFCCFCYLLYSNVSSNLLYSNVSSSSFEGSSPEQTVPRVASILQNVPIGSRPQPHMYGFMPLRDSQDMQTTGICNVSLVSTCYYIDPNLSHRFIQFGVHTSVCLSISSLSHLSGCLSVCL